MAIQGKFVINDADYSPLSVNGVGTFMAFSGNGAYRNRGGCGKIAGNGPIPTGRYWVVERGGGGFFSKKVAWVKDSYNKYHSGAEFRCSEWFALYPDDRSIDDMTWIEGVKREHFRLHPGILSDGCITLANNSDFALLRNALLHTRLMEVPCMKDLMAYGYIEVVYGGFRHADTCALGS